MTCDEFQALSNRNPLSCTRAERAAHFCHMQQCPECRERLNSVVLPPALQPVYDALAPKIVETFEQDTQDEEYVDQTLKAFIEREEREKK